MNIHELDEQTAFAVTQDRPLQVVLDSSNQPHQHSIGQQFQRNINNSLYSPVPRGMLYTGWAT